VNPASLARHQPVLVEEVLHWLAPQPGQTIVDATLGGAGHAVRIAEKIRPGGCLVGIEQDRQMLQRAKTRLESLGAAGPKLHLVHQSFEQLPEVLRGLGIERVDGILADLGFASDQMDDPVRGLSFQQEGPLDMRLNPEEGEPASELLARLSERELADLIYHYGEERFSRRLAWRIVQEREQTALTTTTQLADLVRRCVPRSGKIDPATRTFQALRIAVNNELGKLEEFLKILPICLTVGGRALIISFHSLEDRLVKQTFRHASLWKALTKKPVVASEEEMARNPRARSAKLRAAVRLPGT
jgi:16S rRNA (cytosine1402-N4)-methyltransferase